MTDRFESITLADLVRTAALTVRTDRKYVVTLPVVADLLEHLPSDSRMLEIAGHRSVDYRSMYFDTARLDAYHQTAQRRRRRFKVRTRQYSTGGSFLEVKTRHGQQTVKQRIDYDRDSELSTAGRHYVTERLEAAAATWTGDLVPTLITTYRRQTVYLSDSNSRLTIDTDLRWSDPQGWDRIGSPDIAIVETKSQGKPTVADRLLWATGERPVSISKYGTGLAALHPQLPSNRWHRLLTHRLGLAA